MRRPLFQKITASFMMLLVFALVPVSFCRGECHGKANKETCHQEENGSKSVNAKLNNHEYPSDANSKPMQRVPGFHCPCVLPMPPEQAPFSPEFVVSSIKFYEPYKAIPEVFLPKFIPPHSLT
jgi:hypothetical protein